MPKLSRSQLGLLNLIVREEGVGLGMIQALAPAYGVEDGRLGGALLALLSERLIWPVGQVNLGTYLPAFFLASAEGIRVLEKESEGREQMVPVPDASRIMQVRTESEDNPPVARLPSMASVPAEAIALLADCYAWWALRPMSDRPRSPSHQLLVAAAWGYARLGDERRFARALFSGLKRWSSDGQLHELVDLVRRFMDGWPALSSVTLEVAGQVLKPQLEFNRLRVMAGLTSFEQLEQAVRALTTAASLEVRAFRIRPPDAHVLTQMAVQLEKLAAQTLISGSRDSFMSAANMYTLVLRQSAGMLGMAGPDAPSLLAPRLARLNLASQQIAVELENFTDLCGASVEVRRGAAGAVRTLMNGLTSATVQPIAHLATLKGGSEQQAANWAVKMMAVTELGLAARIAAPLLLLERLVAGSSEPPASGLTYLVSESELDRLGARLAEQTSTVAPRDPRSSQIDEPDSREVEILSSLSLYLRLSQAFPASLAGRVEAIRQTPALVFLLDRVLRSRYLDFRQETHDWMVDVRRQETIDSAVRAEALRQLAELERQTSPSAYLLRLPSMSLLWSVLPSGRVLSAWNRWLDGVFAG